MEKNMKKRVVAGAVKLIGLVGVISIGSILIIQSLKADEPTMQEPSKAEVKLQQKRAKQQKLQREIEKLAGRNLSNEEVLGKEFVQHTREKFGM